MAPTRRPGPHGQLPHRYDDRIDSGTLARTCSPTPGHVHTIHAPLVARHGRPGPRHPRKLASASDKDVQQTSESAIKAGKRVLASIYFATDSSTLSADDRRVLDEVHRHCNQLLSLRKVTLLFIGHADYRGTEQRNDRLGMQRARAVEQYLATRIKHRNYASGAASAGDSELPQIGSTAAELNRYRRVDIIDDRSEPEKPISEPETPPHSRRWKARLLWSYSASEVSSYVKAMKAFKTLYKLKKIIEPLLPSVGGTVLDLEIVDVENHIRMSFYLGALGASAGLSYSASGASNWKYFTTKNPANIEEFAATPVMVLGGGLQVKGRGPSGTLVVLTTMNVSLTWASLFDTAGFNIGASVYPQGVLVPSDGPWPVTEEY